MDVYIAYYVAAAHTLLCKRLEPKGDMYIGTFKPPEAVAASMSVYWLACHHPLADAQRDGQTSSSLSMIATYSEGLGRNTWVAWSVFTGM